MTINECDAWCVNTTEAPTRALPQAKDGHRGRPAIFLDKDGTVLKDVPYNVDPVLMQFAPGAQAGLQRLGRLGLPLIIISNQPGIGMGLIRRDDLLVVKQHLASMFQAAGACLAGFYYCPHHPQAKAAHYAYACDCRKPAPGLLRQAALQRHIDLEASWFVGDILDDVEAGKRAGCKTVLLDNGNETRWELGAWRTPERVEADLDGASQWISRQCVQNKVGGLA